jgi:hypothetical protein
MPYYSKNKCVYKKKTNKKVGCTKGPVKDYMAALHANVEESLDSSVSSNLEFKNLRFPSKNVAIATYHHLSKKDSIDLILYYKLGKTAEEANYLYTLAKDNGDLHGQPVKFEDPQSPEFAQFCQSKKLNLTSEDVEMAGQDATQRIEDSFSYAPKLNEPYEEGLEFFKVFQTIIAE